MKNETGQNGFSLIELMIVIAVVAILVALAVPSYTDYVRKAKRTEAQQILMNWANLQEIWRANHATFADDINPGGIPVPSCNDCNYTFSLGTPNPPTSNEYLLVATPTGDQVKDRDRNQKCNPLTLNQSGARGPKVNGATICWGN